MINQNVRKFLRLSPSKDIRCDSKKNIRNIVNIPDSLGLPDIYTILTKTRLDSPIAIPETLISQNAEDCILYNTPKLKVVKGDDLFPQFLSFLSKKCRNPIKLVFTDKKSPPIVCDAEEARGLWYQSSSYKRVQRFIEPVSINARVLKVVKHKNHKSLLFKVESLAKDLIVSHSRNSSITANTINQDSSVW